MEKEQKAELLVEKVEMDAVILSNSTEVPGLEES